MMNIPLNAEARALDRIVRLPAGILSDAETRQRYCCALEIADMFADLLLVYRFKVGGPARINVNLSDVLSRNKSRLRI